jgi:hypothetical protein
VKAWTIGPGGTSLKSSSAEGAKYGWPFIISAISNDTDVFALSALLRIHEPLPAALPQAVTFRAFGAETQSFQTVSKPRCDESKPENADLDLFRKRTCAPPSMNIN